MHQFIVNGSAPCNVFLQFRTQWAIMLFTAFDSKGKELIAASNCCSDLGAWWWTCAFQAEKTISIGLKNGEYSGKNLYSKSHSWRAITTSSEWWKLNIHIYIISAILNIK